MATKSRKNGTAAKTRKRTVRGSGGKVLSATKSATVLRGGITDLGGTIRLALAGVEDMLDKTITPNEATVINTAVGRVLKAAELHLKHKERMGGKLTALPG